MSFSVSIGDTHYRKPPQSMRWFSAYNHTKINLKLSLPHFTSSSEKCELSHNFHLNNFLANALHYFGKYYLVINIYVFQCFLKSIHR